MILLTTSDYFPALGGLSTFTKNIESALVELGLEYKLFHWKSYEDILDISDSELSQYSFIINIHPQFSWLSKSNHEKMINFIHGSEILMTSPSFFKLLWKKINKRNYFNKLRNCYLNVFISEATLSKACDQGFSMDYSRDIILHNCVETNDAQLVEKETGRKLLFSCIVRNVAHKNLAGSLEFCELVAEATGREVELIVPKDSKLSSEKIAIKELASFDDEERDQAFRSSHYNLLLSVDHSSRGFFEGFGLTVLEAGRFGTPSIVMNTGGLPEAVHHGETGWVVDEISLAVVRNIFSEKNESNYQQMSLECYNHTIGSHSLKEYARLFEVVSKQRGVA